MVSLASLRSLFVILYLWSNTWIQSLIRISVKASYWVKRLHQVLMRYPFIDNFFSTLMARKLISTKRLLRIWVQLIQNISYLIKIVSWAHNLHQSLGVSFHLCYDFVPFRILTSVSFSANLKLASTKRLSHSSSRISQSQVWCVSGSSTQSFHLTGPSGPLKYFPINPLWFSSFEFTRQIDFVFVVVISYFLWTNDTIVWSPLLFL